MRRRKFFCGSIETLGRIGREGFCHGHVTYRSTVSSRRVVVCPFDSEMTGRHEAPFLQSAHSEVKDVTTGVVLYSFLGDMEADMGATSRARLTW
jgi:hypothetical protein